MRSIGHAVLRAMGRSHTYDVRRNGHLWMGALCGLSIPLFAAMLEMRFWPGLLAFPPICAVLFGALGTHRRRAQLVSARLTGAWKELARRDYLTGLYNRRFIQSELRRMLADARATGHAVSVILIDLNGFKEVNDRGGHLEGDRVLCVAARALKSAMRATDLLGRYGGDEFILVKAADRASAVRLVNRAIAAVEEETGLTLCAGIACRPEDGSSPEELLVAADARLMKSKRSHHDAKSFARGR